jgi:hypothetical protein
MGVSVVRMRPLWTDDIPSNFLKLVHGESYSIWSSSPRQHSPSKGTPQLTAVPRAFVDIGVDIVWTSPAKKKRPTDFPRAVKGGAAEGDTCGPRTLTVRSRSQTQWTRPDPSGRPGSASVLAPAVASTRASLQTAADCSVGKWFAPPCKCVTLCMTLCMSRCRVRRDFRCAHSAGGRIWFWRDGHLDVGWLRVGAWKFGEGRLGPSVLWAPRERPSPASLIRRQRHTSS